MTRKESGLFCSLIWSSTSRINGRTTRHATYAVSQHKRKQVEEPFGWMKTYGLLGKLRHRGLANVAWRFRLTAAAYNITRLQGLTACA